MDPKSTQSAEIATATTPAAPSEVRSVPIGDPTLVDTVLAAQMLGIDVTSWGFEELMGANAALRDYSTQKEIREREAEAAKRKAEAADREAEAANRIRERQADAANREGNVRFALALLLVLGSVAGVFTGIVAGLPADQVAQFLAPISGLAGIAVGYFFGRAST